MLGVVWWQPIPTAFDNARATLDNALAKRGVIDGDGNIIQQPQQTQADRGIICGIGANLLKSGIEQLVVVDPWQDDSHNIRRPEQQGLGRRATEPADQNTAKLIDATDCGA